MKKWPILLSTVLTHFLFAAQTSDLPEPRSVRGILGEVQPLSHTEGQLRAGYINVNNKGGIAESDNDAFAVGGHIHLDSKRWYGLMVGAEAYAVVDPGFNHDDPNRVNGEFFDADKKSFITLSQAFIDGEWGNTKIKIGRQMLDTPHADSDDIRMMPNYFLAYMLTNRDIEGLTLRLGQIDRMAGWENGIDAKKFVPVEEVLGAGQKSHGVYLASAIYEGIENFTLQAWYYDFTDIADVVYLDADYTFAIDWASMNVALQYDGARDRGERLLGNVESDSWGVSVAAAFHNGFSLLAAYNLETGDTGAFGSLGGGPFFTSMEDQTLDAIGAKGYAGMLAAGCDFGNLGLEGFHAGIAYGHFEADRKAEYETDEVDFTLTYENGNFTLDAVYATINDRTDANADYEQFRLIANYNFAEDFQ